MKRLRGARYVLLLATFILAAAVSDAGTTLRFSWWGSSGRHERIIKALRLFEQSNPGVKVIPEYSLFTGYLDRLGAQMVVGKEPDLMMINWAWLATLSRQGEGFYDLYQSKAILKLDEYPNESYKVGVVNGKLNGLTLGQNVRLFLWQKNLFERAEISVPKTWDELLQAGRIFEKKLGQDHYPLHLGLYDAILLSHAYMVQRTGKAYLYPNQAKVMLGEDEALEWVRFYRRLFLDHVTRPVGEGDGESLGEQSPTWRGGKQGGSYVWFSQIPARVAALPQNAKMEVGPLLTLPGAKSSGVFGRPIGLFAVSRHSKQPDLAAKLATFLLTQPEGVKLAYPSLGTPQTRSGFEAIRARMGSQEQTAFEQLKGLPIENSSPLFEHPKMQAFLRELFRDVAQGSLAEKAAAQRLVSEGSQLLRSLR